MATNEAKVRITGDASGLENATKKASSSIKGLGSSIKTMIGGIALGAFIKDSTDKFIRQEAAIAQLEARLKSTGGAAGLSSQEIQKMASSLQSVTTFGDEAIIEGQNLLLTFTKIGKDVFPGATEAMLDMSQAMGTDLKSSAIQIGKALQDPIKGITALSRVGVQLSEDQKRQIKSFMDLNDIASAQKIILQELGTQMGGSARAAAQTFGGSIQQLQNSFGDFQESLGAGLASSETFTGAIQHMRDLFADPAFVGGIKAFGEAIAVAGGFLLEMVGNIGQVIAGSMELINLSERVQENEETLAATEEKRAQGMADMVKILRARAEADKAAGLEVSENISTYKAYTDIQDKVISGDLSQHQAAKELSKILSEKDRRMLAGMTTIKGETKATEQATDAIKKNTQAIKPNIASTEDLAASKKAAAEALKRLNEQYVHNVGQISAYRGETLTLADAMRKGREKIVAMVPAAKDAAWAIELTANEVAGAKKAFQSGSASGMNLKDSLDLITSAANNVIGMLGQMGVKTGGAVSNLIGMGEGVAGFAESSKKGDIKGMIAGATKALGSFFALLKGKSGELKALDRITQGLGLSKEQKKAWEEEAKALRGTASAERVMNNHLAELIETTKAGTPQFDLLIRKTREMWAVYEWGNVPLGETVDNFTAAYKAITDQVMASGKLTHEYMGLIKQIEDLKAKGIELAEISELQAQIMQQGLEGYQAYLAGEFSNTTIDVFEKMIAKQQELADHDKIISGVKGLEQALMSLSATQTITGDEFDQFKTAALEGFQAMIDDGVSSNTALEQIAPTLSRLIELSNLYGFSIDDATQALIDQAREAGVSLEKQIDPTERMANSVEELVGIMKMMLGVTDSMSDAFRDMGKSASDAFREAGDAAKTYGGLSKGVLPGENSGGGGVGFNLGGPGFASGGSFVVPSGFPNDTYPIRVSSGEHVQVTPAGELGKGNNVVINYNISVMGNGETEIARIVGDAVKKNTVGVGDKVKQAIGR